MIRIRYVTQFKPEDRPTELPSETRAVLASTCAEFDIGTGGLTREEVQEEDIAALVTFPIGTEMFVESSLASDCLDDTDEETERNTRIWWRVVVEASP